MKRRDLLKLLSAAGVSIAAPGLGRSAKSTALRPNILFVISDDQSWTHTGRAGDAAAGDAAVKTPHFDRIAREGVYFTHSFCSSPSCTPSRAAILTGQDFCRLEEGGNLLSSLPAKFAVYPDLLEAAGYAVGHARKGWGPGQLEPGGRTRNPAGPQFKSFDEFRDTVREGQPFCFWFGPTDPHRPFEPAVRAEFPIDPAKVRVPGFLPDVPEVRADVADYLAAIERLDRDLGVVLKSLEARSELDDTIVVVTSDNGMPFPRAKTTLYDYGTRMPLVIRWPNGGVRGGRVVSDFVQHTDFAPTFLQAAGLPIPPDMTGRSLLPILTSRKSGRIEGRRDRVHIGRERHDIFRREPGNPDFLGYPMRAVRTEQYLYIRNFHPERVPAADAPRTSDSDEGASKMFLREHRDDPAVARFHQLAYGLRPEEELYHVTDDPFQLNNLADDARHGRKKKELRADLDAWMKRAGDPRAGTLEQGDVFDRYPPRVAKPKTPVA